MYSIPVFLAIFLATISRSSSWYTGPDGKIAVEGTPEFEANKYTRKIFAKYGVDLDISDHMQEKMLAELMRNIGLGIIHKIPADGRKHTEDHDDHGDHDDHDDHDHDRKRRNADPGKGKPTGVVAFADSVSSIPHFHENISESGNNTDLNAQCRSAPLLLREYHLQDDVTGAGGIGAYQFGMLCPALIYLTDEKTCIKLEAEEISEKPSIGQVWGYGILSITVISLLSFLGIAIVPLISKSFFQTLLSVLVAGAVGALTGDALLHLIPHSQASSHDHSKEPVFKNLVVLLGIYFLFVVEGIMKITQHRNRRKKQKKNSNEVLSIVKNSSDEKIPDGSRNEECVYVYAENNEREQHESNHKHDHDEHNHDRDESAHDNHGHNHDHGDLKDKGIASVAWMVIAGDGMHNFSDGVAIGAAFSASLVGGLSTSVAVFCHELPHELGDFAILVKAGMSVKQALAYNAFAASLGYLGLILGILIGNYAASVTPWIFALTAGMFLYVALVDMLPEMSSGTHAMKTKSVITGFILQNVGLLIGIGIMLLIALFEENIEF